MDVPERQVQRDKEGKKQGRWELRKAKILQIGGMSLEDGQIVFLDRAADGTYALAGYIGINEIDANGNGFIDMVALGNIGEFTLVGSIIPVTDAGGIGLGSYLGSAARAYGLVRSYSFSTASDERLKKDIKDIDYGLDAVRKLRPVSYKFRKGEDVVKLGFIAQEVKDHVPEVVDGTEETNYGISYDELIPVLTRSIQELSEQVRSLQQRIEELEAKVL